MSLKTRTQSVVISPTASADRGAGGRLKDQLLRRTNRPLSPEIGVPVAGVGVWPRRENPECPRNVASQPAPETSATAAGPEFEQRRRTSAAALVFPPALADVEHELGQGRGEDQHEEGHEHEARPPPHGAAPGVTIVIDWPARSCNSPAAERRSRARAHIP